MNIPNQSQQESHRRLLRLTHFFLFFREESTIDNEGLGRKTSKRCCIYHKQRDFGESSTDSSGEESDGGSSSDSSSSGGPSKNRKKPIARPKQKIANYQRYHA